MERKGLELHDGYVTQRSGMFYLKSVVARCGEVTDAATDTTDGGGQAATEAGAAAPTPSASAAVATSASAAASSSPLAL